MSDRLPMQWDPDDEGDCDTEPEMDTVDMEPLMFSLTGGWQEWRLRDGFASDCLQGLDASPFIPMGGVVVCDGCANVTVERDA